MYWPGSPVPVAQRRIQHGARSLRPESRLHGFTPNANYQTWPLLKPLESDLCIFSRGSHSRARGELKHVDHLLIRVTHFKKDDWGPLYFQTTPSRARHAKAKPCSPGGTTSRA